MACGPKRVRVNSGFGQQTDVARALYQAESDLIALLRPHYARVDQEGRTLLHELFATAGDSCGAKARWCRRAHDTLPAR